MTRVSYSGNSEANMFNMVQHILCEVVLATCYSTDRFMLTVLSLCNRTLSIYNLNF